MTKNNDKRITVRDFFDLLAAYGDQWLNWQVSDYTSDDELDWRVDNGSNYIAVANFIEKHGDHVITDMSIVNDVLHVNVNYEV